MMKASYFVSHPLYWKSVIFHLCIAMIFSILSFRVKKLVFFIRENTLRKDLVMLFIKENILFITIKIIVQFKNLYINNIDILNNLYILVTRSLYFFLVYKNNIDLNADKHHIFLSFLFAMQLINA